jgi:hypothetical protein
MLKILSFVYSGTIRQCRGARAEVARSRNIGPQAPGQTKFGIKKYQDQDLKICILSKNNENSTFLVKVVSLGTYKL